MSQQQQLVILGATGSIGLSTLDVIARNKALFNVFALTAGHNAKKMAELCIEHEPLYAVMATQSAAEQLSSYLNNTPCQTLVSYCWRCRLTAHTKRR